MGEPDDRPQASHLAHGALDILHLGRAKCSDADERSRSQTSIAARALDGLNTAEARKDVVAYLLRYLDTDTVWRVRFHS